MLASPTTASAPPTAINCTTALGPVPSNSKCGNRTPPPFGRGTQPPLPSMRTIAAGVFAVLVGVLCVVTVRYLTAASAVNEVAPSAVASPDPPVQQQLAMPPTAMIADQLDALRYRLAQLQNAILDLQKQQQQQQTGMVVGSASDHLAGGIVDQQQPQQQQPIWPFQQRQMARRAMSWQPMKKRMVSWQPMKRGASWQPVKRAENGDEAREQVIMAIEDQLTEVLQAGERLGISADEILAHLRARNGWMQMEPGM